MNFIRAPSALAQLAALNLLRSFPPCKADASNRTFQRFRRIFFNLPSGVTQKNIVRAIAFHSARPSSMAQQ
jgi:hypothetical protein